MTIQLIDVVTPDIGLKTVGDKLNNNFSNAAHAASYEVGAGATDVPTNANLSASIAGTATFSGDVYTFGPSGTGFRPLLAGMYLSFRLPSGSSNTTTTPDINYNSTTYVIKWIDGSALEADDLDETYNKQPIFFYFDGTDMLIASDISGGNSYGNWIKSVNGGMRCNYTASLSITTAATGSVFRDSSQSAWNYPKQFSGLPSANASSNGSVIWGDVSDVTSTEIGDPLFFSSISLSGSNQDVQYSAIGRWY